MSPETALPVPFRARSQPAWFTPGRLLVIFCLTNLMVYLDRGLIASNGVNGSPRTLDHPSGSGIQGDFNLTLFQDGLLPAAFMVGLLISSPIFAEACKHVSAFRLLAIGMGCWTAACFACAASPNFAVLIIARMLVGVGEASFVSLAAPFIDDYAPPQAKTRWLATFYLCIPAGFAAGYITGGVVASSLGWRYAFVMEAAVMVPFVIFAAVAQPLQLQCFTAKAGEVGKPPKLVAQLAREFGSDVALVASRPVYVLVALGYTAYVAVLGVYSFWGPQAGKALFFGTDANGARTDIVFGAATVVTGIVGSLVGGFALDKIGASLRNGCLLCALSSLAGLVVLLPTFNLASNFTVFMVFFSLGEFCIFVLQAPVAAVSMWCVPNALRPLAISLMTITIHLLGDVPSPPLVGWLQAQLTKGKEGQEAAEEWRVSLSIFTSLLFVAGIMFLGAAYIATPLHDFRAAAAPSALSGGGASGDRDSDKDPLLQAEDGGAVRDTAGE